MKNWFEEHPNLGAWLVLAAGFVAVLAWAARDVGLTAGQWFWLVAMTVAVAGLCAWIISWEADDDDEDEGFGDDAAPTAEAPAPEDAA